MNFKQIEYALAVAEEGSFTRAAERCHTVQSALSHQVARLEAQLGVQLFERTSRRVQLTAAGEAFVRSARPALEATRRIADDVAAVAGQVRGRLSIGSISSLTGLDLVAMLGQFHHRYGDVDIRLTLGSSESLVEAVRERTLDIGFIGVWPGATVEGVALRLLAEEELMAVLPPDHALARQPCIALKALEHEALVDFAEGTSARRQTDEAFAAAGVRHRVQFEITDMPTVAAFVRQGLAIGLVPAQLAMQFSGVVARPVEGAPTRRVYMIGSKQPSPAAAAFMQLLEGL